MSIGDPPKPVSDVNWGDVNFLNLELEANEFKVQRQCQNSY